MKRTDNRTVVWLALLLVCGCSKKNASTSAETVTQGINSMSLDLTTKLHEPGKNTFASAFSVSTALSMLYASSCDSTRDELRSVLHLDQAVTPDKAKDLFRDLLQKMASDESCPFKFDIANAVFVNQSFPLLSEYVAMLQQNYKAVVKNVDFTHNGPEAVKTINDFVAKSTRNLIKELVKNPINPSLVAYLVNAIYFKGTWIHEFQKSKTAEEPFGVTSCPNSGQLKRAKIMKMEKPFRYVNSSALGAELLEIPYNSSCSPARRLSEDDAMKMIVVLPHNRCNFDEWLRPTQKAANGVLSHEALRSAIEELSRSPLRLVNLKLPRFKIENTYNLLKSLSLPTSSSNGACFNISSEKRVKISEITHKAIVEVTETGTVAAAVTGIGVVALTASLPRPAPITFHATRPFLFMILRGSTILFHGVYSNPSTQF